VQNFEVVQIFSQLQKPVRTKLSVGKREIIFLNVVSLVATKVVIECLDKRGNKQDKKEISMIIFSFLCYTIYDADKYQ
jgi:hypothetical protein